MRDVTCTACGSSIQPTERRWRHRQTLDVVHEKTCREVIELSQREGDADWELVDPADTSAERAA